MDEQLKNVAMDGSLSLKAKGLYLVLSATKGNAHSVLDISLDGKHAHYAAYEELVSKGYVMKKSKGLFPENQEKSEDPLFPENQEKFPENQEKPRVRTRVSLVSIVTSSKEKEKTFSPKDKEKKTAPRFTKPKYSEVEEYMRTRKWKRPETESIKFVDFYETKGWMIGKNHMKNWQAAVRTWERSGENVKMEDRIVVSDDPLIVRLYGIDFKDAPDDKAINAAIFCIEKNLKTPVSLARKFFNNSTLNEKFEDECAKRGIAPTLPPANNN
jgi:hypothetical protein